MNLLMNFLNEGKNAPIIHPSPTNKFRTFLLIFYIFHYFYNKSWLFSLLGDESKYVISMPFDIIGNLHEEANDSLS